MHMFIGFLMAPILTEIPDCSLPPLPSVVSAVENAPVSPKAYPAGASKGEIIGIVSGWHPDMPRKRALEEAYSSIFLL